MTKHQRVTFSQARDVLQHAVEHLAQAEAVLRQASGGPIGQREQLLLDSFLNEQSALRSALSAYLEDAPDRVLNTFIQFAAELPIEMSQPEQPLTTAALTKWLEARNAELSALFQEIARSAPADTVGAAFSNLDDRIQAHNRKLSKEYLRFEDL